MQISILNTETQTLYFGVIFILAVVLLIRKLKNPQFFGITQTLELKGFAILAILFSHIGYFLSTDTKFLYPFSILAGVGVNLFLFLSGLGLTVSSLNKPLSILGFYKKRLLKLFTPMWITITVFIVLDFFILQRTYPTYGIVQNFLGYFPVGDTFKNLNSPLWYFTLIFFFYLIFPLTFIKKLPYLSPIIIFIVTILAFKLPFDINRDVISLYKLHIYAFPLGVLFGILLKENLLIGLEKLKFKYLIIFLLTLVFGYLAINSGVGSKSEQSLSLITMFSIMGIFLLKSWHLKLFSFFGIYSYEIYLLHWPILSRFDIFYQYLPASIATVIYLGFFIILGYVLKKITKS